VDEFKRIKNAHGGTINDVVLSVVAGGLGNYMRARGHDTSRMEMKALVPVSVRAESEHGALGNQVSGMMAPLPVWCEDPVERLRLVTAAMGDLKSSGQAVGAQLLTQLTDFAPPTIAAQAARLQPRQRFFNLVVTNIPGPQFPLYLLGREMEAIVPMVPLARNQALCIGIFSYNGQLNFGLTGDYDAMSDLDSFGLDLEAAMGELSKATPKPKRRAAKPAKAKAKAAKQAKSKAGGSNGGRAKPRRATGKTAS
jgi:WS/DGAT/MGAT family acyltransferase